MKKSFALIAVVLVVGSVMAQPPTPEDSTEDSDSEGPPMPPSDDTDNSTDSVNGSEVSDDGSNNSGFLSGLLSLIPFL